MENLNKENYFDLMLKKYPEAMKAFNKWMDDYKKKVNWDDLFNEGCYTDLENRFDCPTGSLVEAPKFHDLPYEMQFGIMIKFACETFKDARIEPEEMKMLFESCLAALNEDILKKN